MRNAIWLAPAALVLTAVALIGMPAAAFAQGMEGEEMAHEERHEHMSAEVTEAITARAAEFAEAFNSGDAAAVAAFYAEDAVVMPPGKEAIEGRAAIEAAMAEEFAGMEGMQISYETQEVFAAHDGAVEIGGYVIEGADGSHVDHGKYMVGWKKTDDGWLVARDIWNSSMGGGM